MLSAELLPVLAAEAARRSRVCWLSYEYAGEVVPPRLVWHVWHDEAVVVLHGDEQRLPGFEEAERVTVTMRGKDTRSRLVTWSSVPERVLPGSDRWDGHAAALLGVRLNLPDPAATLESWRVGATIVRLRPGLP